MTISLFDTEKKLSFKTKPIFKYVYFLPNHDLKWTKNTFRKLKVKNDPDFRLLVVGYYYGTIAKNLFPKTAVTVIDADPLAILANAYAVWLKCRFRKHSDISKLLFLDFYRLNQIINEAEVFLPTERYEWSLNLFKEFIIESFKNRNKIQDRLINYLFNQIFRTRAGDNRITLMRAPKGFCADILRLRLKGIAPDSVIVDDLTHIKTQQNFDAIMTNNSIDFTKKKKYFFKKIRVLVKNNGLVEISSYDARTIRWLSHLSRNKNVFLGNGIFWQTSTNGSMRYVKKLIRMGQTTHILKP